MYRVFEVRVEKEDVLDKQKHLFYVAKNLRIEASQIESLTISKRSVDARKKNDIHYVFNFDARIKKGTQINPKCKIEKIEKKQKIQKNVRSKKHVVVVGSGPAGLFSALTLAKAGVNVTLLERGKSAIERAKDVKNLLEKGVFNSKSNIQFGEGGAGTFSDGKLNTGIKSDFIKEVLETFHENGAPEEILFDAKPHIGTDKLIQVVVNMRKQIENLGGKVLFESLFLDFEKENNKIVVSFERSGKIQKIVCDDVIFAFGYSARDTITHLYEKGLNFSQKPFSVGYRIEHLQSMINKSQFGEEQSKFLPPADYKLVCHLGNGRTVYTFCMCPGGVVVPAQSEEGQLCTNGMSFHAREGENANSAVLVSVDQSDYASDHPLAGMFYQIELEKRAYEKGQGKYVVSTFRDFKNQKKCEKLGKVVPTIGVNGKLGNCFELLPKELALCIVQGIKEFGKKIHGFDQDDAVLTGIETRSSAPFMIERYENLETNIQNIYAVGEGAGRAGGIVSSAVDGIKIANAIIDKYIEEEK